MGHCHAEVWSAQDVLYDETMDVCRHENGIMWERFQVGGRFKGAHDKDIIPVEQVDNSLKCFALVVGAKVYEENIYPGFDGNVKNMLTQLNITTGFLITVDCKI